MRTFDEHGALSREFLLNRGYCCENGCRNCPYGFRKGERGAIHVSGGHTARLRPGIPERIVSLCPSNTELVHALGLTDRLVGIDNWSDWPPETAGLPRVGPDLAIDMARVAALKPDLVVASLTVPGMEKNLAALEEHLLPYVVFAPHSLGDIWMDLRILGRLTGTADRAEAVIAGLQERIQRVRRAAEARPTRPRIYWEWWPRPLFCPGKRNWLTPLSELAGCRSITAHVDVAAARPTPEAVAAADPEFIFLAWTGVATHKVRPGVVLRRPGWERISAVRHGRIHVLEEGLYCRPSPRLIDGLEHLVKLLETAVQGIQAPASIR